MSGCTPESRRCEFWAEGGAYVRPACCTQHLKELLFFTHELLERHGIPHWLDFGALLGAARTGEFVPWDGDVDFGVMRGDFERVRSLEEEVRRAGHCLDMRSPHVWRIDLSASNTLHADLFPWREEEGVLKMQWPGYPDKSWAFPRRFLDGAEPIELYGRSFPAPAPLDEFLAQYRYGPDYMVPRRSEELEQRARIAPSIKLFLARRRFQDRLHRNIERLREQLDATAFCGCYELTATPEPNARRVADDSPDAGFRYRSGDRALFLGALPALEAAGFLLLRQPGGEGDAIAQYRLIKDGACFDFLEQERMGGSP